MVETKDVFVCASCVASESRPLETAARQVAANGGTWLNPNLGVGSRGVSRFYQQGFLGQPLRGGKIFWKVYIMTGQYPGEVRLDANDKPVTLLQLKAEYGNEKKLRRSVGSALRFAGFSRLPIQSNLSLMLPLTASIDGVA